jgi:hypothetical protein
MHIAPQADDAPEFVNLVEYAVNGILRRYSPATLILIKIDNWFGSRWLGFAGKIMGLAGLTMNINKHRTADINIPPFVPERVVLQRRFIAPQFDEVAAGELIHKRMRTTEALKRKAAHAAPGIAFVWYSGNSKENGRGSLMSYLPLDSAYWSWFVDLKRSNPWRVTEIRGIKADDFSSLIEERREITGPVGISPKTP